MDGIGQAIWIILAIYMVGGIAIFANFWIVFENFYSYPKLEWEKKNWIWIIFYVVSTLSYRFAANSGVHIIYVVIGGIYFVRIVPFLWCRYGWKPSLMVIVLFYESVVDFIAQNIRFLFLDKMNLLGYAGIETDISELITEVLICSFLMIMLLLKRVNILRVYFTTLTVPEYVVLFLTCAANCTLQYAIYMGANIPLMKKLSVVSFGLLMVVVLYVIMVREQNTSMNDMIGNLSGPMKQITDSYIEMNEKSTELRRFRHDTKNLLLALKSLAMEGKIEQVVDYIDEMQDVVDTSRVKAFDTGNFIADALLESKAKTAAQNEITMTVEGNIPANRIEDVNLVILISNLVDNAIEAAKQVEGEKKIEIQSILKKNIWILSVKNSCVQDVIIRENRIETTKEEKESHGFGISNIERVAKKYGGNLKLSCENQVFTARATLMLMA
ncbi:sensor histidine kinase [Butyrivibrio sp. AE3003]|uniref:sensor histidine kinase n=1 Tax=Butyrivibrio sp. AE3003 TaxID=1496721 RepID=UPI00047A4ABA|nr:sensor histidine kinase [Butyrivibrio sp. AE3003]